jgi:hypothetical protein
VFTAHIGIRIMLHDIFTRLVHIYVWCPCSSGVLFNPAKNAVSQLLYVSCSQRLYLQFCLIWESQVTSCMNSVIRSPEGQVRSDWRQLDRVTTVIHLPGWYPSKIWQLCHHAMKQQTVTCNMFVVMSFHNSVTIVIRLWTGQLRSPGLIPSRSKIFFFFL